MAPRSTREVGEPLKIETSHLHAQCQVETPATRTSTRVREHHDGTSRLCPFGRLVCWIPLAAFCSFLCLWLSRTSVFASSRRKARIDDSRGFGASSQLILTFMIGLAIETIASVCYWATPYSTGVRALYESVWYWDRIPRQNDYGWPSLKGYVLDHFVPWAVCVLTLLLVRYLWSKRPTVRATKPSQEHRTGTTH